MTDPECTCRHVGTIDKALLEELDEHGKQARDAVEQ